MKNFDLKLEITERDKKLLIILAAVLLVAGGYLFGFKNFIGMKEKYDQQTSEYKSKYRDLSTKNNNREQYEADMITYKNEYNSILASYESGVGQDDSLEFLAKVEQITGSWIKSTTFTDTSTIYTFGNATSSNPATSGNKVYATDMKGLKTTLTLSYEATYAQWKNLISYINNYYSKNSIEAISMAYNAVNGTVSGNITLSTYAITGNQRAFSTPKISLPTGTDNIFSSNLFDGTSSVLAEDNGDSILSSYDFYVLLNSEKSDIDSCVIGEKDDVTKSSVISSDRNETEDVMMRFSGKAGAYRVQYQIGSTQYPTTDYSSGVAFEPGSSLDLLIMSSPRLTESDYSGANIRLVNDSDQALNVKVVNDDATKTRVKITEQSGNINLYN